MHFYALHLANFISTEIVMEQIYVIKVKLEMNQTYQCLIKANKFELEQI